MKQGGAGLEGRKIVALGAATVGRAAVSAMGWANTRSQVMILQWFGYLGFRVGEGEGGEREQRRTLRSGSVEGLIEQGLA